MPSGRFVAPVLCLLAVGAASGALEARQRRAATPPPVLLFDVHEKSIVDLQEAQTAGRVTAVGLARAYLARIDAYDQAGPALNAIVTLNPKAIEDAGAKSGDACFGCHGGRPWYRLTYPYPRNTWQGMSTAVPDWAKNRPTQSDARFLPAAVAQGTKP